MKYASLTFASAFALSPFAALAAQNNPNINNLTNLATQVQGLLEILLPIAVTLAVLFFFWGLAQYILASGEEDAKAEAKRKMIGGVIALFVIVSIWGIIAFLGNILGIQQEGSVSSPGVKATPSTGGLRPIQ
jgi:hypothetical protein